MAVVSLRVEESCSEEPNRNRLQRELVALYSQYRHDLECASVLQSEYLRMVEDARGAHRDALTRIRLVRRLLDVEFPGWDSHGQLRLLDEE